jgi:hypothetical protein
LWHLTGVLLIDGELSLFPIHLHWFGI